jgi:hypothetical protein
MLDVVDLFREHDTRDELDHDPRAVLSSRPLGVSEAGKAAPELNLVEAIERSDDNDGNIGKLANTTLKRLPSSVYWQGLCSM